MTPILGPDNPARQAQLERIPKQNRLCVCVNSARPAQQRSVKKKVQQQPSGSGLRQSQRLKTSGFQTSASSKGLFFKAACMHAAPMWQKGPPAPLKTYHCFSHRHM